VHLEKQQSTTEYLPKLKGQAPTQIVSKEKGMTNKTLLDNEHSASSRDANYDR